MACMFIGLGLGMLLGDSGTGTIIGMGVGFIAGSFIKVREKISLQIPRSVGGLALILIGVGFILLGLNMIGMISLEIAQHFGGIIVIGLGLLFLGIGGRILLK